MKVCGFTIIRNAVKYDYPVVEAITSILPVCDKFIVLVGNSDDNTLELIQSIDSEKIIIQHSTWDDSLREGGRVLAIETDKAKTFIPSDYNWAFYIQSDEVIHEKYHNAILQSMEKWKNDHNVDGLLFKYLHFYGSYDYVGTSRRWYRHEIRIIKNDPLIHSYRDAQGFRKQGKKLKVKPIDAYVYHYGWVKDPLTQAKKHKDFNKLWHDDQFVAQFTEEIYNYSDIDYLETFDNTHPNVMINRISQKNWDFDGKKLNSKVSVKDKFLFWLEQKTGIRLFEYKNYHII
ncbi:MAG: glycosyltransferase family 2 protein [Saprospiraceae bacterium]|nr:glycosyltransferase family 2 protein [Saprospiraceae bacterium]